MATLHQAHIKKEPGEGLETMPDSTTKERSGFSVGEDVLLQQKDGRFYLGTVILVELSNERCLVKFGDNTQRWSKFKELCRLSLSGSERPVCLVCKKSSSQPHNNCRNDIVRCDKCGRGYHQLCHQPKVTNASDGFVCRRCVGQQQQQACKEAAAAAAARKQSTTRACKKDLRPPPVPVQLPYDPGELTWDVNHRTNVEQRYCYCGKPGEWFMQMVQCGRCRQWFHECCLRCLQFPLFCGDRFYVFVCALCNDGEEFVRRLELAWVDLVHVALYNLTVIYAKKYYDLDTMIVPYINERWDDWQLPPKLYTSSMSERRDQILAVLQNDKIRFKCGREIKKRTSIWGLRNRLPPFAPSYSLPSGGRVDENVLRQVCDSNRRLRFISPAKDVANRVFQFAPVLPVTPPALNGETGLLSLRADHPRQNGPTNNSKLICNRLGFTSMTPPSCPPAASSPPPSPEDDDDDDEVEEEGSATEPDSDPGERRDKGWRRQRRGGLRTSGVERRGVKRKGLNNSELMRALVKEDDNDLLVKKARKLVKNAIAKGQKVMKPLSPSLPESTKTQTNGVTTAPSSTPADTSGDETSSRGTLDLFIPPPKDFEGQNNPFRSLHTSTPVSDTPTPTLPPPLAPPSTSLLRPTKRQLCENDIRIDKNGEVKRRRLKRGNGLPTTTNNPASNLCTRFQENGIQDSTSTLRTVYPRSSKVINVSSPPRSGSTCVEHAMNSGRLRSQAGKEGSSETVETPPVTPTKSSFEHLSMEDIKTSLNHYFGAANRIVSGESFKVLAKRTLQCGRQQFLLEWDTPGS